MYPVFLRLARLPENGPDIPQHTARGESFLIRGRLFVSGGLADSPTGVELVNDATEWVDRPAIQTDSINGIAVVYNHRQGAVRKGTKQ